MSTKLPGSSDERDAFRRTVEHVARWAFIYAKHPLLDIAEVEAEERRIGFPCDAPPAQPRKLRSTRGRRHRRARRASRRTRRTRARRASSDSDGPPAVTLSPAPDERAGVFSVEESTRDTTAGIYAAGVQGAAGPLLSPVTVPDVTHADGGDS